MLSEEDFSSLIEAGCTTCKSKALVVEAIVARKIPLHNGEPFGAPSWGYKGEDLVRGTFRIACDDCKRELFTATACPRCNSEGGIERAIATENTFAIPVTCAKCDSELVTVSAFVPALVRYDGKIAQKATTQTVAEDPGFRAFRVECKQCHDVLERRTPCPICAQ